MTRSLPHGHAAAVHAMARTLGFPALLGPPGPQRDLAYALVISRVLRPASKLSTAGWWDDVTLGPDLGVAGASTDDIYAAMDWLVSRQDDIEKQLAARHLAEGGIAMFDLSSSWVEGRTASWPPTGTPATASAASRRSSTGCSPTRRACRSRCGCSPATPPTRRPSPRPSTAVRQKFALEQMIMVGDRGMITTARIKALRELEGMAWITCLRAPAIKKLMADDGPLQLSLFDEQDLAEITSADYPGERLIACRNPFGPPGGPAPARSCWPPPRPTSARSPPGRRRTAQGPGQDRPGGRESDQQTEGRQALHPRHPRRPHHLAAEPGQHRRRGRHRRDLRHPHPRPRRHPGCPGTVAAYKDLAAARTRLPVIKAETWTCVRSTTGSRTGSAPTC